MKRYTKCRLELLKNFATWEEVEERMKENLKNSEYFTATDVQELGLMSINAFTDAIQNGKMKPLRKTGKTRPVSYEELKNFLKSSFEEIFESRADEKAGFTKIFVENNYWNNIKALLDMKSIKLG